MIQRRYRRSSRTGTAGSAVARHYIRCIRIGQGWCCRRGCGVTAVSDGTGWRTSRIRLCTISYTTAACAHGSGKCARDDKVKITSIGYSFQHVDFLSVFIGGLFIRGKVFFRARFLQDCSAQKGFFLAEYSTNTKVSRQRNFSNRPITCLIYGSSHLSEMYL